MTSPDEVKRAPRSEFDECTRVVAGFLDLGYADLVRILLRAAEQAAIGKGRERHAIDGVPWPSQPIVAETELLGPGFAIGQIRKKAREAMRFFDSGATDRAEHELLGLIVYAAAAVWFAEGRPPTSITLSGPARE